MMRIHWSFFLLLGVLPAFLARADVEPLVMVKGTALPASVLSYKLSLVLDHQTRNIQKIASQAQRENGRSRAIYNAASHFVGDASGYPFRREIIKTITGASIDTNVVEIIGDGLKLNAAEQVERGGLLTIKYLVNGVPITLGFSGIYASLRFGLWRDERHWYLYEIMENGRARLPFIGGKPQKIKELNCEGNFMGQLVGIKAINPVY